VTARAKILHAALRVARVLERGEHPVDRRPLQTQLLKRVVVEVHHVVAEIQVHVPAAEVQQQAWRYSPLIVQPPYMRSNEGADCRGNKWRQSIRTACCIRILTGSLDLGKEERQFLVGAQIVIDLDRRSAGQTVRRVREDSVISQ